MTAFQNFLANEWDKARAQKRGGGVRHLVLDFAGQADTFTVADYDTPERIYERKWAIALLTRVMERLQREQERNGHGQSFQALREYIGGAERSYAAVAAELGLSEPAARMAASRLRSRYRDLLKDEVAHTVSEEADIDAELRHLLLAVSG
jgi:DNA-directed RNA polymerase specialized sigma24 family protein